MIFSFAMFKIPGEKQFCVIISDNFKSTEWLWKTVFLFILLKKISIYKQVKLVLETLCLVSLVRLYSVFLFCSISLHQT